jgi:uncharacterized SAM-binding protein YcdF (DUF218 family)
VRKNIIFSEEQIEELNIVIKFLAKRDIETLDRESLLKVYGIDKADMLILLGNGIPYISEVAAEIYKKCLVKEFLISGGIGHSTKYLCDSIRKDSIYNSIEVENKSEADILSEMISKYLGIQSDKIIIENSSTNCGANAVETYNILKKENRKPKSIILIQDPTMQLRTYASFEKVWEEDLNITFISFAPFIPLLRLKNGALEFQNKNVKGLWSIDRFLSLIMGEIPRLLDNEDGYGPKGKGFIAHVDVPSNILNLYKKFENILKEYSR